MVAIKLMSQTAFPAESVTCSVERVHGAFLLLRNGNAGFGTSTVSDSKAFSCLSRFLDEGVNRGYQKKSFIK